MKKVLTSFVLLLPRNPSLTTVFKHSRTSSKREDFWFLCDPKLVSFAAVKRRCVTLASTTQLKKGCNESLPVNLWITFKLKRWLEKLNTIYFFPFLFAFSRAWNLWSRRWNCENWLICFRKLTKKTPKILRRNSPGDQVLKTFFQNYTILNRYENVHVQKLFSFHRLIYQLESLVIEVW